VPWVATDAKKHKKGLTPAQAAKWAKIANGVLKQCKASGGKDCEGKAIRIANSKFDDGGNRMKEQSLPKGALRLNGGGEVQLQFGEGEAATKPKLRMVGYSGNVIKDHWYWGNLGIQLSGMKFSKSRYPLLQDHRTDVRLAHMGTPEIKEGKLFAPEDDVVFLENGDAQKFLEESAKGFPFEASIYAKPRKIVRLSEDEEHLCNGFVVKGPGAVWLESEFREMSVCVFGADSNTSAAAFSEDLEPCTFAEVDIAGNSPTQTTMKEVKRMDKEQLKKEHPDLYAEIVAEGKAQFTAPQPDPEIKTLKEDFVKLSEENKALKKENDVRREKELKLEADSIFTQKLSASEVPERLHEKVKGMVDYNKFVKDQALDTKAFGEAVDAEIKDWIDRGIKKSEVVLGETTTVKQVAGDKNDENQKLSDRLLSHIGQTKKS
jgi:hypothetical protein